MGVRKISKAKAKEILVEFDGNNYTDDETEQILEFLKKEAEKAIKGFEELKSQEYEEGKDSSSLHKG
jgi:ribosomal protein L4